MLSKEEIIELKNISEPLIAKIKSWSDLFDKIKKSHLLETYLTIYTQKKAFQDEINDGAFTIRGKSEKVSIGEDGIEKESENDTDEHRKNVETVLKVLGKLCEYDEILERLYNKMTVEEKEYVREKAGEAESILETFLNGKKK